jgi:hypothetical protein
MKMPWVTRSGRQCSTVALGTALFALGCYVGPGGSGTPSPERVAGAFDLAAVNGESVPGTATIRTGSREGPVQVQGGWIRFAVDGTCEWRMEFSAATRRVAAWGGRCTYSLSGSGRRQLRLDQGRRGPTLGGWIESEIVTLDVDGDVLRFQASETRRRVP